MISKVNNENIILSGKQDKNNTMLYINNFRNNNNHMINKIQINTTTITSKGKQLTLLCYLTCFYQRKTTRLKGI